MIYPKALRASLIGCLLIGAGSGFGQDESATLTLDEAIRITLVKNLGLQINRINPEIAEEALNIEQAAFDFTLFGSAAAQEANQASISDLTQGTASSRQNFRVGGTKNFSTGATAEITTDLTKSRNNSPSTIVNENFDSSVGIDLRQPLLRGAGKNVNLAPINRAKSALGESRLRLTQQVLDLVSQTEIAYWTLSFAYAQLAAKETALDLSETLLEETREKERLGLVTKVDLLQSEANFALRQEELITAEQQIENAADSLRSLLGNLTVETDPLTGAPKVAGLPKQVPPLAEFFQVWESVLSWDLDLAVQNEVLRQLQYDELVARNRTNMQLDLTAGAGLLGRDDTRVENAIDNALSADGHFWSAGIQFSVPWGARDAKARLRRTEFFIQQEEIRLGEIQQRLLEDTRRRWRDVRTGIKRFEASQKTLDLRVLTYEQAEARFAAGLITFREVLEAQRDLDDANLAVLDAKAQVIQAAVLLSRLDGSLIDRHNLNEELSFN